MVNKDDEIRFVTPTAAFALGSNFAVRYRPSPDGTEIAEYFRDGERTDTFVVPPTPHNN
jgi:hypothetical protein